MIFKTKKKKTRLNKQEKSTEKYRRMEDRYFYPIDKETSLNKNTNMKNMTAMV